MEKRINLSIIIYLVLILAACNPEDLPPSTDESAVLVKEVIASGNGCKDGNVDVHMDEKGENFQITFNEFDLNTSKDLGKKLVRKSCNLAIKLQAKSGKQAIIAAGAIVADVELGGGAKLVINSETFLAGNTGEKIKIELSGKMKDSIVLENLPSDTSKLAIVGCDTTDEVVLRINLSARLRDLKLKEESFVKIESLGDTFNGLKVLSADCKKE